MRRPAPERDTISSQLDALEVQRRPTRKKNSTCSQGPKRRRKASARPAAIGMDLGDKSSRYCVLDEEGEIVKEDSVGTTKKAMLQLFSSLPRCQVAIEVGTHSPWVSRLLKSLGFEVTVANSRSVPLISASSQKSDRQDAQMLARLVRVDPQLLRPIRHRGEQAQTDLMRVKVRAALVEARTSLVNAARGLTKAAGERLPCCDADAMGEKQAEGLPMELQAGLRPLFQQVESLPEKIKGCEAELKQIAEEKYPETELLQQIKGVGPLIALTFVLTVEDPERFQKSREWAVTWDCGRSGVNRASSNPNWGSPKKATSLYGRCWCKERIPYSGARGRTRI